MESEEKKNAEDRERGERRELSPSLPTLFLFFPAHCCSRRSHYVNAWNQLIVGLGFGVLPIMASTGRLRPKGVSFSGFRKVKG